MGISMGFIEESEAVKNIRTELEKHNGLLESNNRFKTKGSALTKDILKSRTQEKNALEDQLQLELQKGRFQKLNFEKTLDYIDQIRDNLRKDPIISTDGEGDDLVPKKPDFVRNMEIAIDNFRKEKIDDLMVKSFQNAFQKAEDALVDFIRTGKLDFKNFVVSQSRSGT